MLYVIRRKKLSYREIGLVTASNDKLVMKTALKHIIEVHIKKQEK